MIRFLVVLCLVFGSCIGDEIMDCVDQWVQKGLANRFTRAQLQWLCEQQRHFRLMSTSQRDLSSSNQELTPLQVSFLASLQPACTDGACRSNRSEALTLLKTEPTDGQQTLFVKAKRKEFRTLSRDERNALGDAFNRLKSAKIDGISKYDLIGSWHYPDRAPGAHQGPAFLPWHREFLKRLELALRAESHQVAIPYWDSRMDNDLPDPRDSLLWTDEYFGNGNGYVTSGPFRNWAAAQTLPGHPDVGRLFRNIGSSPFGALLRQSDVDWVLSRRSFSELTMCVDPTFELTHGLVHVWVGGYMLDVPVSTNDPVFYFHHSFVDYEWESLRRKFKMSQSASTLGVLEDWPPIDRQCNPDFHSPDSPMRPFDGLRNRDGLSDSYTSEWYEYEDSPSGCRIDADCRSEALWCHTAIPIAVGRCRAKIRVFGNCTGLDGTAACYQSKCTGGSCFPEGYSTQRPVVTPSVTKSPEASTELPTNPSNGDVFVKTLMLDENGPIMNGILKIRSVDGGTFEAEVAPAPSSKYPEYPGVIYAPVPDPTLKRVAVQMTSADQSGRPCRTYCRTPQDSYVPCNGTIRLSSMAIASDPVSYSHSESVMPFLDVDISQHPVEWVVQPPYIGFICGAASDPQLLTNHVRAIKPPKDSDSKHVWFHVLVMDGRTPLDRSVPGATVMATSMDDPTYQYRAQVESDSQFPKYFGAAYVQAPNPTLVSQGSRVHITAADPSGRQCKPVCDDGGAYDLCKGDVTLSDDEQKSNTFSFSSLEYMKLFLGWDLTSHPSEWRRVVSPLQFLCFM